MPLEDDAARGLDLEEALDRLDEAARQSMRRRPCVGGLAARRHRRVLVQGPSLRGDRATRLGNADEVTPSTTGVTEGVTQEPVSLAIPAPEVGHRCCFRSLGRVRPREVTE